MPLTIYCLCYFSSFSRNFRPKWASQRCHGMRGRCKEFKRKQKGMKKMRLLLNLDTPITHMTIWVDWQLTHTPTGLWTYNLTFHPILIGENSEVSLGLVLINVTVNIHYLLCYNILNNLENEFQKSTQYYSWIVCRYCMWTQQKVTLYCVRNYFRGEHFPDGKVTIFSKNSSADTQ